MLTGRMSSAVIFALFAVLTCIYVGNVTASCKQVANDEMLEYVCESGDSADLIAIPATTEKLRISRMPLHRITADTFSRFGENLWVLGCSHCNITDIDVDAFRGLVNLQQLSLDNNRLTSVRAAWFRGLSYLTYLDLNYNDIHEIEDGVYRNLPSLVDFRISGNRLRCLNLEAMSHLKKLKFMLLSENPYFVCPHAVSKYLESQSVIFEKDPEWSRLASDTIDVRVPPRSHAEEEEDRRATQPANNYEKLYPDERPSEEREEEEDRSSPRDLPPLSRDREFYPNQQSKHRGHPRRPITTTARPTTTSKHKEPVPRVEPRYPPSDVGSHVPKSVPIGIQRMPPYPYSVAETTRTPESGPGIADNEASSQVEHAYPAYVPTSETAYYPTSYTTSGRPQTPPVNYDPRSLSGDSRIDEVNGSASQTQRTYGTYVSSYVSTTYDMPRQTSERSQTMGSVSSLSRDETTTGPENIVTYPLYVHTTSGDREDPLLRGYVQVTYPSADYDVISWKTSVPIIQHSTDDPAWTQNKEERYEQSRSSTGGGDIRSPLEQTKPDLWETQFYGEHDSRKLARPSVGDILIPATNPVERDKEDRSQTTMSPDTHYVRPSLPSKSSQPELIYLPSTDESHLAPYYESTVTVHPPLRNYSQHGDATDVFPLKPNEDKPLPECPNQHSAALMIQSAAALLLLSVITVFGHRVIVEGF